MILTMSDETAEFGNSGVTVHRVTVLEKNNLKILPPDGGSHHTRFSRTSSWVGGEAFEYI